MMRACVLVVAIIVAGCASPRELSEARAQASDLQVTIQQQDAKISSLEAEVDDLDSTVTDLHSQLTDLQTDLDSLKTERDKLLRENANANASIISLTGQIDKLVCGDQITDMKYQNILDASTIVAAWWARQPSVERVQGTYRDSIWSNADTKIHAVRYIASKDHQPYVEHFLVYFDEFGMKPGVFWVGGQCWLDAP